MRKQLTLGIVLSFLLILAGTQVPTLQAQALQSPLLTPALPDAAAITLSAVEPKTMVNAVGGTLSVYGTGFTTGCAVRLVGHGLLSTAVVNETALTAQVPPGVTAASYDVEVVCGDQMGRLARALTILGPTPTPAPTQVPAPPAAPPPGRPILTIRNYSVTPTQVKAGEEFVVTIEIYNNGSRAGENTMAVFPGGTFVPVGETGHMIWQLHINHTAVVTQKFRAPSSLASGVYQAQVNLSANDWEGSHFDYPQTVPVEVIGKTTPTYTGKPEVTIEGAGTEPAVLMPGAPFSLTLRLANRGSRTAINVLARCNAEDLVIPAMGSDTVSTPQVAIEDVVTVTLPLSLMDGVQGGRQKLAIELAYSDYSGGSFTRQENVGVDVNTSLSTQPQLLIQRYHTTPDFVSPGDAFTLTLALTNVGGGDAQGLTLALGGEGGAALEPFSPLTSGNVLFLERLRHGETLTVSQAMIVDGAAAPKVYNLPVALAYDDARKTRRSDTQRLSLIVRRRPELQAAFYREPEALLVDAQTPVALEVINTGRSAINILRLEASGEQLDILAEGTPFVGPLEAGGSAPLDVTITPRQDGPAEIIITVTYRDDLNQTQVLSRSLAIRVGADHPRGDDGELITMPEPTDDATPVTLIHKLGLALKGFLGFGS